MADCALGFRSWYSSVSVVTKLQAAWPAVPTAAVATHLCSSVSVVTKLQAAWPAVPTAAVATHLCSWVSVVTKLQAAWPAVPTAAVATHLSLLQNIQTNCRVHPASCWVGTGNCWQITRLTHKADSIVPRLRMSAAVPLLPLCTIMVCLGTAIPLLSLTPGFKISFACLFKCYMCFLFGSNFNNR